MIIDMHAHTSNHKLWGLHVSSATLDYLGKMAEERGIDKIVLMATYFPFKGSGLCNEELLRRIGNKKRFLMFGSIDIMNNLVGGINELRRLAEASLISGIKLYPGYQDFDCSDVMVREIYKIAQQSDIPVMFHSGELHHCCQKEEMAKGNFKCGGRYCYLDRLGDLSRPKELSRAIKKFPQVKFILSHLGNPHFGELRDVLRECPNAFTDISGQFVTGSGEDSQEYKDEISKELEKIIEIDGVIDRLMFASDFPIQSYEDSIDIVRSLNLSKDEEEKVFSGNAKKILNLKEE